MNLPNIYIVCGTLLIAFGGLLATFGWSARSDLMIRNGLIKAVSSEYLIYETVILHQKIIETDQKALLKPVIYSKFHTLALEGLMSSGLFIENDKELYTRAVELHELLHELNSRFAFSEDFMRKNPQSVKMIRLKLRDGKTRKSVMIKLELFGRLLENKYGNDFTENVFVNLKEDINVQ